MKTRKAILAAAMGLALVSAMPGDSVISTQGQSTVVNTTELTRSVRGYRGPTPVKIYIKKNKIERVEALPNKETPNFFDRAKVVLNKYKGKDVKKAATMKVDGVSGATMSSEALIKNVQAGLDHYNSAKK